MTKKWAADLNPFITDKDWWTADATYAPGQPGDLKADRGKPQWSLLPWDVLPEVLKVVEYGDRKYKPGNWRAGSPPSRYWDAAFRHMHAWQQGERLDPESGHQHLAHAVVSLLYAMVLDAPKAQSVCGAVLTSGSEVVICQGQPGHTGPCRDHA